MRRACWTNLKETREYAEEKLRTFGITVSDTSTKIGHYWLTIWVSARRLYKNQSGSCLGALSFSLTAWSEINGKYHNELGSYDTGAFVSSSETCNKPVMLGFRRNVCIVSKRITHLSLNASSMLSNFDAIDRRASLTSFISRSCASLSDVICASSTAIEVSCLPVFTCSAETNTAIGAAKKKAPRKRKAVG